MGVRGWGGRGGRGEGEDEGWEVVEDWTEGGREGVRGMGVGLGMGGGKGGGGKGGMDRGGRAKGKKMSEKYEALLNGSEFTVESEGSCRVKAQVKTATDQLPTALDQSMPGQTPHTNQDDIHSLTAPLMTLQMTSQLTNLSISYSTLPSCSRSVRRFVLIELLG